MKLSLRRRSRKTRQRKLARGSRFLRFESLELRRLLAADINGTIYDDVNSNGVKSGPDNTLAGWTAFVDIDQDGILNNLPDGTSEPFAVANAGGDYTITMAGRRDIPCAAGSDHIVERHSSVRAAAFCHHAGIAECVGR